MANATLPPSVRNTGRRTNIPHREDSVRCPRGSGYFTNASLIAFIGCGFSSGGHILGASALQDFLCFLGPRGIVRMNGQKNPAIFNAAFVPLRFVLGDSHTDQSTRKPT